MIVTIRHAFLAAAAFLPDCLAIDVCTGGNKNENRNGVARGNRSDERCFRVGKFYHENEAAAKARAAGNHANGKGHQRKTGIMKFDLDKWLKEVAEKAGIKGGQGRSGAAMLFSALIVFFGIVIELIIAACAIIAGIIKI